MKKSIAAALMVTVIASAGFAQGISLDELEQRASEAPNEMTRLRDLLADPDGDKAMRALSIVMAEGSFEQKRIALEAGIGSTSKAIRRTAMQAFLNTGPLITIQFDGSALSNSPASHFTSYFKNYGSVSAERLGQFTHKVGPLIEARNCWSWAVNPDACMLSLTDENVTFYLNEVSGAGTLSPDGFVKGNVTVPNSSTVPYVFKVTF